MNILSRGSLTKRDIIPVLRRRRRGISNFLARTAQEVILGNQIVEKQWMNNWMKSIQSDIDSHGKANKLIHVIIVGPSMQNYGLRNLQYLFQPRKDKTWSVSWTSWFHSWFVDRIRQKNPTNLNNAMELAYQKVLMPRELRPPGGGFSPSVVIQGKVHNFVGPLRTTPGIIPKFAQIWVYDPNHEHEASIRLQNMRLPNGTTTRAREILSPLLHRLQIILRNNPYVKDFITACEIPDADLMHCRLVINACDGCIIKIYAKSLFFSMKNQVHGIYFYNCEEVVFEKYLILIGHRTLFILWLSIRLGMMDCRQS